MTDSVTNKLAAGVSFRAVLGGRDSEAGFDGRLALGLPLSNAVSLGVSGRYLSLHPGSQSATTPPPSVKGFTLDAALRITPAPGLDLAFLADNLVDLHSPLTPVRVGGSASYAFSNSLLLGADCLVDLSTFSSAKILVGGGIEYLAGGSFPLRLGYSWDQGRNIHTLGGSIGYVDQQVGLDLGLRQDVAGAHATEIGLGLRYHVQ